VIFFSHDRPIGFASFEIQDGNLGLIDWCVPKIYENHALGHLHTLMDKENLAAITGWHHKGLFADLPITLKKRDKEIPMVLNLQPEKGEIPLESNVFSRFEHV